MNLGVLNLVVLYGPSHGGHGSSETARSAYASGRVPAGTFISSRNWY